MIDPIVERHNADCNELLEAWRAFLDQFNAAVKAEDASGLTPEVEQRFMEVKARIAMLHDSFLESLKHDKNIGQNMIALVNRAITLRHMRRLSASDQKKVEIEWHECYLLLNETVGHLAEERERLAEINEFSHNMGVIRERIFLNIKWFFTSIYFKIIVAVGIIAAIAVFTPTSVWDKVRTMKGIGEPYGAFIDFKRDKLGMGGPYGSVDSFHESTAGKATEYTVGESNTEKAGATATFLGMFDVRGQDSRDFLESAGEFKSATITPSDAPQVNISMFFWRERDKAVTFSTEWDAAKLDMNNMVVQVFTGSTTIFHVENVLVILTGGTPEVREDIRMRVFR